MVRLRRHALIARGAMGEIWLGLLEGAEGFRRAVVIKRATGGAAAREALVEEARLGARLGHPGIATVFLLLDTEDDGLCLVMEHLSGLSLRAVLSALRESKARMPWPIATRIAIDAARALDAAHRARDTDGTPLHVVHRDVSPENLVVTDDGVTKVVDFGIARSALREVTHARAIKGKLAYLAPEQVTGGALGPFTDAFALGAVLYETLTGDALFLRRNDALTLRAIVGQPVPALPADVPAALGDVLVTWLAKRPEQRTLGLADGADMLEPVCAGRGGSPRDVASFLAAELPAELERRQRWLRALVSDDDAEPIASPILDDDTATVFVLDAWMDGTWPGATTARGSREEDTEVDPSGAVERGAR